MELINYKKLDNYTYFESDSEYYYIPTYSILIDKNKNILINSNISLINNEKNLKSIKNFVDSIDLTTSKCVFYKNIICIQHWYTTYGHFKDELFNLYNFYKLLGKDNYNVLMNYNKPPHIGYSFNNYDKLSKLLFEPNIFINIAELNTNLIKISNLILINHDISSPMFHMFPKLSVNKILSNLNNSNVFNKNVFITRGKALHLPRNLDNQEELEQYFLSINYNVINPEIMDIQLFINNIKNAENVFITWGGAMVNLCYVNPNSKIYLLKSLSYKHEEIFSIFKFLKTYKNLYLINCNDENKIDLDFEKNKIKLNS